MSTSGWENMNYRLCAPAVAAVFLFLVWCMKSDSLMPIKLLLSPEVGALSDAEPGPGDVHRSITNISGRPSRPPQAKARTILVTGALGCIGPGVVQQLLAAQYDVTVLDISGELEVLGEAEGRVRFIQGDIRDEEVLAEVMPTVSGVVNLAAMSRYKLAGKCCAGMRSRVKRVVATAVAGGL